MATGWLFVIDEDMGALTAGQNCGLWSWPPRDAGTGDVRLRRDGNPYMPAWKPGDEIVVFYPFLQRCVAILTVTSLPTWNEDEGRWDVDSRVRCFDRNGPALSDIGVPKALQGGRHRLRDEQYRAAQAALT